MKWPLPKLVEIEWIDSCTSGGWRNHASYVEEGPTVCRTIGYLLHKSKEKIIVIQTQSASTGHVSDSMAIPMVAVKRMRVLKGGL